MDWIDGSADEGSEAVWWSSAVIEANNSVLDIQGVKVMQVNE